MARRRTLPEILADDTGRIRPEVADLLMESVPQEPHCQSLRPILQEVPRESLLSGICLFLGLMIFSALCLWTISYRLSSKATMEEKQVSNSANLSEETPGQKMTGRELPPASHQEKIESEVIRPPVKEKKVEEEKPKFTRQKNYEGFIGGCR